MDLPIVFQTFLLIGHLEWMVWKLAGNSIELIIYVEPWFMQVCAP